MSSDVFPMSKAGSVISSSHSDNISYSNHQDCSERVEQHLASAKAGAGPRPVLGTYVCTDMYFCKTK